MQKDSSMEALEELFEALSSQEGVLAVFLIVFAIIVGVLLLCSIALYIFNAVVVTKLAKKADYKYGALVWIPFVQEIIIKWVLMDMAGDKPFSLFGGKITFKDRKISFYILLGISVVNSILGVIIGVVSSIPVVGVILYLIGMIILYALTYASKLIDYVYLRDVGEIFKENKDGNRTVSIVVTVVDALITGTLARTIYLATMLKCQPVLNQNATNENICHDAEPTEESPSEC